MGHRWWLEQNHPYMFQKRLFDGPLELRGTPLSTTRSKILLILNDVQYIMEKE